MTRAIFSMFLLGALTLGAPADAQPAQQPSSPVSPRQPVAQAFQVVPMDDLVEVGVFAAAEEAQLGDGLYLRMHRVRSGGQRFTVTVPGKPARAGIDPRNLLIDVEPDDNVKEVAPGGALPPGAR